MLNKCLTLTSSINQPFADQSKKKILLNCVAQSFFTSSVKKKKRYISMVFYRNLLKKNPGDCHGEYN